MTWRLATVISRSIDAVPMTHFGNLDAQDRIVMMAQGKTKKETPAHLPLDMTLYIILVHNPRQY